VVTEELSRGSLGAARQLFGHHDHSHGVLPVFLLQTAVSLWYGQTEHAHFLEWLQDGVGDNQVFTMYLFRQRRDHVIGKPAEGVAHHGVVFIQQVWSQVTIAIKDLLTNRGNINAIQLGTQEFRCYRLGHNPRDLQLRQIKVRWPCAQSRQAGVDCLRSKEACQLRRKRL